MSKNQLHGKTYEDYLKSAFPGSSDHERLPISSWDIEKQFDKINTLPTSIKTTGGNVIDLADARKYWNINEPYRLLVGKYTQSCEIKKFHSIYEFQITVDEHAKLLGNVLFSEVESFHNSLLDFGRGNHEEARKFAQQRKMLLKQRSIIQLNPKIDSKTQRRLQCSINLKFLINNIKDQHIYSNTDFYRGISVNFAIQSSEREFNNLI